MHLFRSLAILVGLAWFTLAPSHATEPPSGWVREWPQTDFSKSTVEFGTILSGGPPKDGIPSIDDPKFKPVSTIDNLKADEPVVVLRVGSTAKAYPLRVLTWHEIANDVIEGRPVAVTYCPLCNTAIAFDRTVDGQVLEFGVSGKLRKSDMIMYDRQTESWWQQFTGVGIIGAHAGTKLTLLSAPILPYGQFAAAHPEGQVLVPTDPTARRYGINPYPFYDTSARPFLYRGDMVEGIEPLAYVVAVGEEAWPLETLREAGEITSGDLRLVWQEGMASALDNPLIAEGRDVGFVEVFGAGAKPVPFVTTFAFAFHAFHPDGTIHGLGTAHTTPPSSD